MRHRSFILFLFPSLLAMLVFIAVPLVSVVVQSMHVPDQKLISTGEVCGPFGCTSQPLVSNNIVDEGSNEQVEKPNSSLPLSMPALGRFVGLEVYGDRAHLAIAEVSALWKQSDRPASFAVQLMNLPFYRALGFTLVYALVVTPIALLCGFWLACLVAQIPRLMRSSVVFVSVLPFFVTPLVGSLLLFWMFDTSGVVGHALQWLSGNSALSIRASAPLTWLTLIGYGIWHSLPLAFIVYYAGLHTVPRESVDSARVDGASRLQITRYVIAPHLATLTIFLVLILLMDNFRVLEPIIGFASESHAMSLSYSIFTDLRGDASRFNSAAATSVLTIVALALLLLPVLLQAARLQRSVR